VTATTQQSFEGFGVCIGNIADFLPAGGRKGTAGSVSAQVYDRLFKSNDPNSVKLSYLRLSLAASNYKNTATASYDFTTAVEKTGQGNVIRAARTRNSGIKLLFSSWTPPYWMKNNNKDYNTEAVTSDPNVTTTNRLKTDQYSNYASLLKTFCNNFNTKFGFYPHALSLQNEPDMNVQYGSCVFTADQYKGLLTATRNAFGWSHPTQLWGPELGGSAGIRTDYVSAIANAGLLNAIAQHPYNGDTGLLPDWAKNNLKVHQTEYAALGEENHNNDEQYIAANSINKFCRDANRGKVSSWFHWNAVGVKLPNAGKDIAESLLAADAYSNPSTVYKSIDQTDATSGAWVSTQGVWNLNDNTKYPADGSEYSAQWGLEFNTYKLTPLYYAFRRLSHSVTPGSVSRRTSVTPSLADGTGSQDDVYAAGFKRSDGKYCLVVANTSKTTSYNSTLKINELSTSGSKGFNTYYTSSDGTGPKNDVSWTTELINGQTATTLYPRSVTIFVQQ
ncbi:MAG: hypothetical protein H7145_10625, partial [Akkermansiaceae bacterium]|nr:hypothetical protein [Armatimonadota bacterium]